jgi:arylsulfatase A-like enzyme
MVIHSVLPTLFLLVHVGLGRAADSRPNIVYIMADDHASSAISCYGSWLSKDLKTPNIDRIAQQGMRFNHCLVTNSICTPSRAAILTGQYSHINGVYTLSDRLDPERQNVAKLLHQAGYRTAIFGKWHLQSDPSGFDDWTILPGQGRYHNPLMYSKDDKKPKEHKGFSCNVVTDLSIEWLKNRPKDKPFLLLTHFKAPHRPWDPADKYAKLYEYYYGKPLGMKGAIDKPTEPEWELFDLQKDPEEMKNVYDDRAYANVVKDLKAELERLRTELKDNR